jgi:hypothetical protein
MSSLTYTRPEPLRSGTAAAFAAAGLALREGALAEGEGVGAWRA